MIDGWKGVRVADYLLDTTALIDHLHGRQAVTVLVSNLVQQGHRLGVCCVNVAELYSGLGHEERARADRLIATLEYYEVTSQIAKEAGRHRYEYTRQGRSLSTTDTLIAATAIDQGATLITANTKDFPMEEIQLLEHP